MEQIIGFIISLLAILFFFRKPPPKQLSEEQRVEKQKLKKVLEQYGLSLEDDEEEEDQHIVKEVIRVEKKPTYQSLESHKPVQTADWAMIAQPESAIEAYRIHADSESLVHHAVGELWSSRDSLRGALILGEILGKPRSWRH